MTWEKADNLPVQIIEEFEHGRGDRTFIKDTKECKMGQTVHTLVVQEQTQPFPAKCIRAVISGNTG